MKEMMRDVATCCVCMIPATILICLIPFGTAAGCVLLIICGFLYGITGAMVYLKKDSLRDGIKQIFQNIYEADISSDIEICGGKSESMIECFNFGMKTNTLFAERSNRVNLTRNLDNQNESSHGHAHGNNDDDYDEEVPMATILERLQSIRHIRTLMDISRIWDVFFAACVVQGAYAIEKMYIKRNQLRDLDPG